MSSIIRGFNCDIFISYRQNDNRSGWVTEFVNHLNEELAATIKEPVSVYFDSNPDTGLLETHHVDKSLEGKLRCVIFVPILSQTYCDEKSFAWQHELLPFCQLASTDGVGRDILLPGGNVGCRILPVRIHDIDPHDKKLFETTTGTALRAVDFVFRSAGVNRPLREGDDRAANLNHTYYPDQVNKVANAIKEIFYALTHATEKEAHGAEPVIARHVRRPARRRMMAFSLAGVLTFAVACWLAFFYQREESDPMQSIAVLPFSNLSDDPNQEYFSDGITDQIITSLSHLGNVKVIARTSVMKYKKTTLAIPEIGRELKVKYVLEGSVQKVGNKVKINAQLIRADNNSHEWAEIFNRDLTDIFQVQDDISGSIANALGRKLVPATLRKDRPANLEAYDYFLKARHIAFNQYYWIRRGDINQTFQNARKLYEKAIALDPSFATAYAGLADLYDELRNHDRANFPDSLNQIRLGLAEKAFALDPNNAFANNVRGYVFLNSIPNFNGTPTAKQPPELDSALHYLRRAVALDPEDYYYNWCLGNAYQDLGLHEDALPYLTKAREKNPMDPKVHVVIAPSLYTLGRVKEAVESYETAMVLGQNTEYFGQWHLVGWMLLTNQLDRAEAYLQANPELENPWNIAMRKVLRGKEKALSEMNDPGAWFYFVLGQKEQGLRRAERNIDNGSNFYLALKNIELWKMPENPQYEQVTAKAKVLYDKMRARYVKPVSVSPL